MWEKVHVLLHMLEDSHRYDVLKKPANSISISYYKRRISISIAVASNWPFHMAIEPEPEPESDQSDLLEFQAPCISVAVPSCAFWTPRTRWASSSGC